MSSIHEIKLQPNSQSALEKSAGDVRELCEKVFSLAMVKKKMASLQRKILLTVTFLRIIQEQS